MVALNLFRLLGDLMHLLSIFILVWKIRTTRSCSGDAFSLYGFMILILVICIRIVPEKSDTLLYCVCFSIFGLFRDSTC